MLAFRSQRKRGIRLAAGWVRHAGFTGRALGAGVLGGLLAGEAVYGHHAQRYSSPASYWYVQFFFGLGLAVGLAVGLTLWRSRRRLLGSVQALALSLAGWIVIGLGTLAAFQLV